MKEHEREALVERAEREGAPLGAEIPEEIELDGRDLRLQEYVFEARAGKADDVGEVKRLLRRRRLSALNGIRDDEDMSYEEGERLVEEVAGIDRALNILEGIGSGTSVEAEARAKENADEKRWLDFLKKVTGSADDETRR